MTLAPGKSTNIDLNFTMPAGMGGAHDFRVHLSTNDPAQPEMELTLLSNWVE